MRWLVSARMANHTSLTPSSLPDAATLTTWLKASHSLYDIQINYRCSLKLFISSLVLASALLSTAVSHRLPGVYVNRVKWVTDLRSKVALQGLVHTCFVVERLTLKLGFRHREKAQAASVIWNSWPLRLDSVCLLGDIVCFTPENPLSSLTPFMVSGVHSDSSRSDPERPRGPGSSQSLCVKQQTIHNYTFRFSVPTRPKLVSRLWKAISFKLLLFTILSLGGYYGII